jgi:hypothetical protein
MIQYYFFSTHLKLLNILLLLYKLYYKQYKHIYTIYLLVYKYRMVLTIDKLCIFLTLDYPLFKYTYVGV